MRGVIRPLVIDLGGGEREASLQEREGTPA